MNHLPAKKTIRLIPELRITLQTPSKRKVERTKVVLMNLYSPAVLTVLLILVGFSSYQNSASTTPQVVEVTKPVTLKLVDRGPWGDEVGSSEPQHKAVRANDTAPVLNVADDATKAYINTYKDVARKEQAAFGVPASISLAQGLIESNAGQSRLAKNANNHFGMKCFSRNCKKGHCINATDDTHKDFFRKYTNAWESWRDHSRMLSKGRYAKLKRYGTDYRKWAYGLKSIGYATDRTYAEKLIGIIEKYKLNQYDK